MFLFASAEQNPQSSLAYRLCGKKTESRNKTCQLFFLKKIPYEIIGSMTEVTISHRGAIIISTLDGNKYLNLSFYF